MLSACNLNAILTKSDSRKVCSGFCIRFVFLGRGATGHLTHLTPTQARLPHSASYAASKTCSSSILRHLTLEGCFRMTHMCFGLPLEKWVGIYPNHWSHINFNICISWILSLTTQRPPDPSHSPTEFRAPARKPVLPPFSVI